MTSSWDGTRYTSPEIFEQESRRIFERFWMCVARAETVQAPGSFHRAEIGTESVLLVRDRYGTLRGLLNLCRHRGARLCTDRRGALGKTIRCMYHGWSYGLDGTFVGAPYAHDLPRDAAEERNLFPVRTTEWLGYIWLNLSSSSPPLTEQMEPQLDRRFGRADVLTQYTMDKLTTALTKTYDVCANWKLILENFCECYHCPTLHPELSAALPYFRTGYGTISGPVRQGARFAGHMAGFSMSGRAAAPALPDLRTENERTFHSVNLWPNAVLILLPDHVVCLRLEPVAPDRTQVTADWLFHPDATAAPDFDPCDAVELLDLTNQQDFQASERCQLGARSKRFTPVYPPREHVITYFHHWVDQALAAQDES